jgi:hypothetical protein
MSSERALGAGAGEFGRGHLVRGQRSRELFASPTNPSLARADEPSGVGNPNQPEPSGEPDEPEQGVQPNEPERSRIPDEPERGGRPNGPAGVMRQTNPNLCRLERTRPRLSTRTTPRA